MGTTIANPRIAANLKFRGAMIVTAVCGLLLFGGAIGATWDEPTVDMAHPGIPASGLMMTQLPASGATRNVDGNQALAAFEGARLVRLAPGGKLQVLTPGFASAADPSVSFDGKRVLFAGKKTAADHWQIYEMAIDGGGLRQVVHAPFNCRQPIYLSKLFVLTSDEPWYTLAFAGDGTGTTEERGGGAAWAIYSARFDGSEVRRLTSNVSADVDPFLGYDGRILYSSFQWGGEARGAAGEARITAINLDGTDFALAASNEGPPFKRYPAEGGSGLMVFAESDDRTWDGGGRLAAVSLRRPLRGRRVLTPGDDFVYAWPSALAGDFILASRRPAKGGEAFALVSVNTRDGSAAQLYKDPKWHSLEAVRITARKEPDGRSSVVTPSQPTGALYGLNPWISDVTASDGWKPGIAGRLRVIEGVPENAAGANGAPPKGTPPLRSRMLGDVELAPDGSFNLIVPANVPIKLQLLDSNGLAVRSCSWIWVRNREARGCIGCHEDGEMTPENRLVDALKADGIALTLPPARRRTVAFERDIAPMLLSKCVSCHPSGSGPGAGSSKDGAAPDARRLYEELLSVPDKPASGHPLLVHTGSARRSSLLWHIFGRNLSQPWDGDLRRARAAAMPVKEPPLTSSEIRTLVEWIDLGADWAPPRPEEGYTTDTEVKIGGAK